MGLIFFFIIGDVEFFKIVVEEIKFYKIIVLFGGMMFLIFFLCFMFYVSIFVEVCVVCGLLDDFVCISCGIEDVDDLLVDL